MPPPGLGPAQAAYLLTGRTDGRALVATLLHAAQYGAVRISREGGGWTVVDTGTGWDELDPVTRAAQRFLAGQGLRVARKDREAGERLRLALEALEAEVRAWARAEGGVARLMRAAATGPGGGRRARSEIGGFRWVLASPSSRQRFDFTGRDDLYAAYLPWAVAFGCAREWAAKYRAETGAEPPMPAYLGITGRYAGGYAYSIADDLGAVVDAAVSAYQTAHRPSSEARRRVPWRP